MKTDLDGVFLYIALDLESYARHPADCRAVDSDWPRDVRCNCGLRVVLGEMDQVLDTEIVQNRPRSGNKKVSLPVFLRRWAAWARIDPRWHHSRYWVVGRPRTLPTKGLRRRWLVVVARAEDAS